MTNPIPPSAPVKDEGFDALLPCPFCGGLAELRRQTPPRRTPPNMGLRTWMAVCIKCGAPGKCGFSQLDATELWNRRHQPTTETPLNQCDGCRRNLPLVDGVHRGEGWDLISCTADRYITPDTSSVLDTQEEG